MFDILFWSSVSNVCGVIVCLQLLGLGAALLDNVDPNPENYVCAGVIQTKGQQVGCLLRLEPNGQAQVQHSLTANTDQ